MKENIEQKQIESFKKEYLEDKKNTIIRHALSKASMDDIVYSLDSPKSNQFTFSIDLKTLPVSNQRKSGRCWIFSASTVLREIINRKLHVKDQFEISQNYISYFDKLEKYNYYLENIILLTLQGRTHDDRKMAYLLQGVSDGGQWDMYVNLVKKYGIVPKSCFPETAQSENTRFSTILLNSMMRKFASEIARMKMDSKGYEDMEGLKGEYMKKVYDLLTNSFGVPPTKFDFEYMDDKDVYHIEKDLTPISFFEKYVGDEIDEYVSIIHAPTKDKEYYHTYNIELLGNVIDGKPITHLNLPLERIKELIVSQLQDNEIVWFGSDVSYYGDRPHGVWDDKAFDFESTFGIDFKFDKADMLDYGNSMMNHAMCITGVNLVDDKPNRYKIENSWGSDAGNKGYYVMSDSWFDSFVYQVAIKKKYLNEKELKALSEKPILLPPWDPFGTLAD
jgi:bleomycin hydrolase